MMVKLKNNQKYEAVIGMEIHAELKTKSKMFCSCKNLAYRQAGDLFNSQQNINVCPVCLGMPGMLPVLNEQAIEMTIKTGLYLNNKKPDNIAKFTKWDRKNYFYPDLPKGYQISQYDLPIVTGGFIGVGKTRVDLTRIHLEEDTGTSKHPEGRADVDYSLMDYNRAGVPLMELVTEPIVIAIDEAGELAKLFCLSYQIRLRMLGVADADMEKGQMRCEANISVKPVGQKEFGTKVEVKNLNSFKAVERAINFEIQRQIDEVETGNQIIQETRGWDDAKNKTYTMRVKETSADYRYFPEPDLPPYKIDNGLIKKLTNELPESWEERVKRYIQYGLNEAQAILVSADLVRAKLFEETIELLGNNQAQELANLIINNIKNYLIKPQYLAELINLVNANKVSKNQAKEILPEIEKGQSPLEIIKEKGLEQISDEGALVEIIKKVIAENSDIVKKIKSGQTQVIGFLVGQVMKESKGQANPQVVNEILRNKILN